MTISLLTLKLLNIILLHAKFLFLINKECNKKKKKKENYMKKETLAHVLPPLPSSYVSESRNGYYKDNKSQHLLVITAFSQKRNLKFHVDKDSCKH